MRPSTPGTRSKLLYSEPEYDLIELPLSAVSIPMERFRSQQDDSTLRSLAVTLNELPLINEIGVSLHNGKYELIYGEARLATLAAQKAKVVRAKCWRVDPDTALYMQLAENAARGSYDKAKLLKYVVQLSGSKKLKGKQIAQLLGVDKSELSKLRTISTYPEPLQRTFVEKNVPVDVMYELRLIEADGAKANVLNLILLAQYSKDAARHYIRHIQVLLCDRCGKTGRERNSPVPLTLHGKEWLCADCLPEIRGEPAHAGPRQEPASLQSSLAGNIAQPTQTITTCSNCQKEYQHALNERVMCDSCLGRMNILQAMLIQKVGPEYWTYYPAEILSMFRRSRE